MERTQRPTRSLSARRIFRALLGIVAAALLGVAALGLFFLGIVTFTGCFWACHDPDPHEAAGTLLFVASAAAGGGAITSLVAGLGLRRRLLAVFIAGSLLSAAITSVSFVVS